MSSKKFLFTSILAAVIIATCYSYRWIFTYQFDPVYYKHYYDHSQWSIPLSPRVMGDGELYRYAGYRLVEGDHPFQINPEVPPLGKYLYGASIKAFNNPYLLNIPLYLLGIWQMMILAGQFFKSSQPKLLAGILFAASPLIFSQLGDSALDLLLTVLALLYLNSYMQIDKRIKTNRPITIPLLAASFYMGLFVSTKFGLFAAAFVLPLLWLLYRRQKYAAVCLFVIVSASIYTASYSAYFLQGHSVLDWLKNQKWILNFYLSSEAVKNPSVFFATGLFGWFKWSSSWERVSEWSVLWSLGVGWIVSSIMPWIKHQKRIYSDNQVNLLAPLLPTTYIFIILFMAVPFFVRYITLLLPILILACLIIVSKSPRAYQYLIVIVILAQSVTFIWQTPMRHTKRLEMLFNTGRYEDAYDLVQAQVSRDDFSRIIHQTRQSLYANKIIITIGLSAGSSPWSLEKKSDIFTQINTPLGDYNHLSNGRLMNERGMWKLRWDWEHLVEDLSPQSTIQFIKDDQFAGSLFSKDGVVLSKSTTWPYIIVIPQLLEQSPDIRPQLSSITGLGPLTLNYTIHVNQPADMPVNLGTPKVGFNSLELDYIASHSAVILDYRYDISHRLYPQGAIDRGFVDLIKSIEATNPRFPKYRTGSFVMTDQSGIQTEIISNQKMLTQDIVLDQTVDQLFGSGARTVF